MPDLGQGESKVIKITNTSVSDIQIKVSAGTIKVEFSGVNKQPESLNASDTPHTINRPPNAKQMIFTGLKGLNTYSYPPVFESLKPGGGGKSKTGPNKVSEES